MEDILHRPIPAEQDPQPTLHTPFSQPRFSSSGGTNDYQTDGDGSSTFANPSYGSEMSSTLDLRRAVLPEYHSAPARMASFACGWPERGVPRPRNLVPAGFMFTGIRDSVRCFYCGVTLKNWRENDDPWETHIRFRFSCDYVTTIKGEDFVLQTMLRLARAQSGGNEQSVEESRSNSNGSGVGGSGNSLGTTNAGRVDRNGAGEGNRNENVSAMGAFSNTGSSSESSLRNPSPSTPSSSTSSNTATSPATARRANGTTASSSGGRGCVERPIHAAQSLGYPDDAGRSFAQPSVMVMHAATGMGSVATLSATATVGGVPALAKARHHAESSLADSAVTDGRQVARQEHMMSAPHLPQADSTDAEPGTSTPDSAGLRGSSTNAPTSQGGSSNEAGMSREEPSTRETSGDRGRRQEPEPNRTSTVPTHQSRNTSSSSTVDNRNEDVAAHLQQLQVTNDRLRQMRTCRLCGQNPVDTIFLPCGHLCTCECCAATIRDCCLCRDRIRGTAHVYLE